MWTLKDTTKVVNIRTTTTKKQTHRYREKPSGYQPQGRDNTGEEEWEAQTVGSKIGCKTVLYNTI